MSRTFRYNFWDSTSHLSLICLDQGFQYSVTRLSSNVKDYFDTSMEAEVCTKYKKIPALTKHFDCLRESEMKVSEKIVSTEWQKLKAKISQLEFEEYRPKVQELRFCRTIEGT